MEYRYWTFMESHPAHVPLPENALAEAMNTLTWCYTDCLLPSQQTVPPPFTPQECQELMGLLRSSNGDAPSNRIVHTRIVARVLLRQAHWRQQQFRPDRPFPSDSRKSARALTESRVTLRRIFMDLIMSVFCLGIPYLFMGRSFHHRVDEESGMRSQGPFLVISACACLIAAVILSASVTLLTLPGLDDIARLAGMIAILLSASSMVSAVAALFKYKADIERTVVYVGGEGLMVMSRRSIVLSLPIVFLAWAIAAFITGITFYSFRGVTLTNKVVIRQPFVDYTHWVVVGSLGGLVGILLVSGVMARR
ncbi:uncharacterized protein PHACADRAFT_132348 [Phanerochaete carnosa HHB-10118-sp]|uniref:Uncharacterized protein n=1 Tax=Phanerochaete carnosa (strain HHB-10118-sp) TaxID=650164 RepID=K5VPL2_PHACS|nr:uncharacterized protein PHACADRAFT_132348 [Phanerochaete carnosa HHB-10118-sp]EKM48519.1 hypothetical protein PHACADRAFT_132348 [Phanerochaete carnosa HHB-10118-sp]